MMVWRNAGSKGNLFQHNQELGRFSLSLTGEGFPCCGIFMTQVETWAPSAGKHLLSIISVLESGKAVLEETGFQPACGFTDELDNGI